MSLSFNQTPPHSLLDCSHGVTHIAVSVVIICRLSVQKAFSGKNIAASSRPSIRWDGKNTVFSDGVVSLAMPGVNYTNAFPIGAYVPDSLVRALVKVAFAAHSKEPILLVGPSCFKTLLVNSWARMCGRQDELITVHLTRDTETTELVGQIQPYTFLDLVQLLPQIFGALLLRLVTYAANQSRDELL